MTVSAREVQDAAEAVREARVILEARLDVLLEVVAHVPLPPDPDLFVCPVPSCGIGKTSDRALADHLENVHGVVSEHVHAATASPPPTAARGG